MIRVNGQTGEMTLLVDEQQLAARKPFAIDLTASHAGFGRELFSVVRHNLSSAEEGAVCF